jgi:hypothetical protein
MNEVKLLTPDNKEVTVADYMVSKLLGKGYTRVEPPKDKKTKKEETNGSE